ncbi:MAG: bifunctional homocysteine S-methyltransferase/methylenetetrahydrofolate reductase, partial [Phycisphaerae bacterium]|nr:bifunctional homocysteine S-methyltransferase/methylenetetrahydrofolate reductase [Phycisphaerae bacterium]
MLYRRGIYINQCYDNVNLMRPHLVKNIHHEYIQAGAQIIETNTFGANRHKLARHGLADKVREINLAGARLAREASEDKVWVAGAVGPLHGQDVSPGQAVPADDRRAIFREQIAALVEGEVDLIMLETFSDVYELLDAIRVAAEVAPDLPRIAQVAFLETQKTRYGMTPEEVVEFLKGQPIDVLGANCGSGPAALLDVVDRLARCSDKPISVQPNAGMPKSHEDRMIYMATSEYVGEYARRMIAKGARILGTCCGSTPEHTRGLVGAVRMLQPGEGAAGATVAAKAAEAKVAVRCSETTSRMAAKLRAGEFVVSIEIDPPQGTDAAKALEGAAVCRDAGVDCINIADGPRASARMSPIDMAVLLNRDVPGIEPIVHFCCRDRNILGMQADLIGANAIGVLNVLCITGDPPKLGDYPFATSVYDVDAIGLVRIAKGLNDGHDLAGNPMQGAPTQLHIGAGANPGAIDLDLEIERLEKKVAAGAEYILTQPVYDFSLFERFYKRMAHLGVPMLLGILPLASYRNAEFLHREVPGMQIPKAIRERMRKQTDKEAARREGIAIAQQSLRDGRPYVQGTYIMPPFNRVDLALAVLEVLGE